MFGGNHIDAIGFIEVLVFVDEEQVTLFEGDGLLVATQVLIITPTNIFFIVTIKVIIDCQNLQGSSSGYSLAAGCTHYLLSDA